MKSNGNHLEKTIVAQAKSLGASLAGIAAVDDLKASPSYAIYDQSPFYEEYKGVKWRAEHRSVLVWALVHPASEPVLDWWSMKVPGFTPGNGVMRLQSRKLRIWLGEEFGIKALSLPYQIEYGGGISQGRRPSGRPGGNRQKQPSGHPGFRHARPSEGDIHGSRAKTDRSAGF